MVLKYYKVEQLKPQNILIFHNTTINNDGNISAMVTNTIALIRMSKDFYNFMEEMGSILEVVNLLYGIPTGMEIVASREKFWPNYVKNNSKLS